MIFRRNKNAQCLSLVCPFDRWCSVQLFFIRWKIKSRWIIIKRRFRGTADLTSGIALRRAVNQIIAFTAPIIFHANLHSPMQSKQKWFPIIPHNHCSRNCSGRVVKITRQNRVKSLTFIEHSWGREAWPWYIRGVIKTSNFIGSMKGSRASKQRLSARNRRVLIRRSKRSLQLHSS